MNTLDGNNKPTSEIHEKESARLEVTTPTHSMHICRKFGLLYYATLISQLEFGRSLEDPLLANNTVNLKSTEEIGVLNLTIENSQSTSEINGSETSPAMPINTPTTCIWRSPDLVDIGTQFNGLGFGTSLVDTLLTNWSGNPKDREAIGTFQSSQALEDLTNERDELKLKLKELEESIEEFKINAAQIDLEYSDLQASSFLDCIEAQVSSQQLKLDLTRVIEERNKASGNSSSDETDLKTLETTPKEAVVNLYALTEEMDSHIIEVIANVEAMARKEVIPENAHDKVGSLLISINSDDISKSCYDKEVLIPRKRYREASPPPSPIASSSVVLPKKAKYVLQMSS